MINRSLNCEKFITRDDDENEGAYIIEGYFSVFDSPYIIGGGMVETVSKGAFSETLGLDIRRLINHDSGLVIGRTKANTLELFEDNHGLFGRIHINPKDTDAKNIYERVKRGDVSQCSFGFDILDEDTEIQEDGTVHFNIRKVKLYEVSIVTFPRYEETEVSARSKQAEDFRKAEAWRITMLKKLSQEESTNGNKIN